ncbi:MAG: hypothetical protein WC782_01820 [Methylococcaceae bacterium]
MPYVNRGPNNRIIGINSTPLTENSTWLEDTDLEVIQFILDNSNADSLRRALLHSDSQMGRVVEDLIDLLIEKQAIIFTELPEPVQFKLGARKQLREHMQSLTDLIKDNDTIF